MRKSIAFEDDHTMFRQIVLYPQGSRASNAGHLSIFLLCRRPERQPWAKFSLKLVNSDPSKSISRGDPDLLLAYLLHLSRFACRKPQANLCHAETTHTFSQSSKSRGYECFATTKQVLAQDSGFLTGQGCFTNCQTTLTIVVTINVLLYHVSTQVRMVYRHAQNTQISCDHQSTVVPCQHTGASGV